nr:beta-globin [Homo sapiens]
MVHLTPEEKSCRYCPVGQGERG